MLALSDGLGRSAVHVLKNAAVIANCLGDARRDPCGGTAPL